MKWDKNLLLFTMNKKLSLGTLCKTFSGGTPSVKEKSYYINGTIPFIRSGEIHGNKTQLFLTEKGVKHSSAKYITKGDLLIALYGANSGDVAISQIDGVINQAILCIRSSKLNITYLKNLLLLEKDKILRKYLQGGQGNLSAEIIKSLKYNFPPIEEQKRIAEVLATWDEGIENLEKLIALKEKQKRALMQRLLTGKTRLKGFSTPWKKVKLGDVCIPIKRSVGEKRVIPMSLSAGIGFVPQAEKFGKDISGNQYKKYTLLSRGDFTYNKGNSKKYPQGCAYLLKEYNEVAVPNVFISFRLKRNIANNQFFEQFFFENYHGKHLRRVINSGVRNDGLLNLNTPAFYGITVLLPSINEQKAISKIFTSMDEEISLLKNKLEVFRKQKKYLMQQLLTGKKRLA